MNKRLLLLLGIMFFSVLTSGAMEKAEKQENKLWITNERSLKILNDIEIYRGKKLAAYYFEIEKNDVKGSDIRKLLKLAAYGIIRLEKVLKLNSKETRLLIRTAEYEGEYSTKISQSSSLLTFIHNCTDLSYTRGVEETFPEDFPLIIPKALCVLSKIQKLYIDSAVEIDPSGLELPCLISLRIWRSPKAIPYVMHNLTQYTQLNDLSLISNELSEIPNTISYLTNLERLDFSSNNVTTLPSNISQLSKLTTLNLSDNPIAILPESMTSMKNLNWLGMRKPQKNYECKSVQQWQKNKPKLFKSIK